MEGDEKKDRREQTKMEECRKGREGTEFCVFVSVSSSMQI